MATRQNSVNTGNGSRPHSERVPPTDDLHQRNSSEIKQRIDRTRGAMDETLQELSERLSPRQLIDDAISAFRSPNTQDAAKRAGDVCGDFAQNLGRQVRENPLGVTLVGAGLAWLAFGNRTHDRHRAELGSDTARDDFEEAYLLSGEEDPYAGEFAGDRGSVPRPTAAGLYIPESYTDEADETHAGLSDTVRRKASAFASGAKHAGGQALGATQAKASSAGENVSSAANSAVDTVKSAASSVGSAVSSTGAATSRAARGAANRSRAAGHNAMRGTSAATRRTGRGISDATQFSAEKIELAYQQATQSARQAHREYPLAVGLGVMALGAMAGLLVPRTRREDQLMGDASDQFRAHAQELGAQAYERGRDAIESNGGNGPRNR